MKIITILFATCILSSCTYAPYKSTSCFITPQFNPTLGIEKSVCYTEEMDIPSRYETYQVRKVVTQTPFVRIGNPYGTSGSYGGGYYQRY